MREGAGTRTDETRRIGLSLGADEIWPEAYEEILRRLDLALPLDGRTVRFTAERTAIEPFRLGQPGRFDLVIDRLTHWYRARRESIKKSLLLDDLYVLNNPWTLQSMDKPTAYSAMLRLGLPVPDAWVVPPKAYEPTSDLETTLQRYGRLFDVGALGDALGYPVYFKPCSGGGWVDVTRAENAAELREAYERSGTQLMHVQRAIVGHDRFVRAIGLGPQVRIVRYNVTAPLHARYCTDAPAAFLDGDDAAVLEDMTLTINTFFGWEFNSCEALRKDGVWHPIDFTNACPDSQLVSIHYHLPWLVKALLRWTLFAAATRRRMRLGPEWDAYLEAARTDAPLRERLRRYGSIARERLEADRFAAFCATHLPHLDEVARDYFRSARFADSVRRKVESIFPPHEHDEFTEYFRALVHAGA